MSTYQRISWSGQTERWTLLWKRFVCSENDATVLITLNSFLFQVRHLYLLKFRGTSGVHHLNPIQHPLFRLKEKFSFVLIMGV